MPLTTASFMLRSSWALSFPTQKRMDITYLHWLQSLLHRFLHTNQVRHRQAGFAIITRDAIDVHFTHHPQMRPEENNSVCRIVVSNIEALYQEILSIHALHPHLFSQMPALTTQPWGDKEINIVDPCGILIRFSEPISQTVSVFDRM